MVAAVPRERPGAPQCGAHKRIDSRDTALEGCSRATSRAASYTDQGALGVGEVTDDKAAW